VGNERVRVLAGRHAPGSLQHNPSSTARRIKVGSEEKEKQEKGHRAFL
jgi:hypothetical protein